MEAEICEWAKSLGYKTEESKLEFVGLETESAQSLCTAPLLPVWKHLLTRVKPKKTVDSVRSQLYSAVLAKDPNDIPESLRTSFERVKEQALKRQQLIDKYDNIRQQNSEKRAARLDLEQELETRIKMHREQSSALREMEHQAKMEQDRLTVCETIISKIESIESALHHHQTQELGSLETPVSRIDINSRFDVPELSEQASRDTLKLVTPMNKLYVDTYFETGQASFKAQRAKDQVGEKMKELDDYLSKMSCSEEEKRTLHDKIEAQALHSMHLHLKMQLEDALEEIETQKPFEERIEAAQEQVREKLEALDHFTTQMDQYHQEIHQTLSIVNRKLQEIQEWTKGSREAYGKCLDQQKQMESTFGPLQTLIKQFSGPRYFSKLNGTEKEYEWRHDPFITKSMLLLESDAPSLEAFEAGFKTRKQFLESWNRFLQEMQDLQLKLSQTKESIQIQQQTTQAHLDSNDRQDLKQQLLKLLPQADGIQEKINQVQSSLEEYQWFMDHSESVIDLINKIEKL